MLHFFTGQVGELEGKVLQVQVGLIRLPKMWEFLIKSDLSFTRDIAMATGWGLDGCRFEYRIQILTLLATLDPGLPQNTKKRFGVRKKCHHDTDSLNATAKKL